MITHRYKINLNKSNKLLYKKLIKVQKYLNKIINKRKMIRNFS